MRLVELVEDEVRLRATLQVAGPGQPQQLAAHVARRVADLARQAAHVPLALGVGEEQGEDAGPRPRAKETA